MRLEAIKKLCSLRGGGGKTEEIPLSISLKNTNPNLAPFALASFLFCI